MVEISVKTIFWIMLGAIIVTLPVEASGRFIEKIKLPTGQTVVVSEGEFEARSLGSFSIRLYQAAPPTDETTFFISGLVSERDGIVEKLVLADITGDAEAEIIVVVRSVGTGNYLSAYAFGVDQQKTLVPLANLTGLSATADPVMALRELK
jgi:hypothetical protein